MRDIGTNLSGFHYLRPPLVEISPPDIACRRQTNWGAIQADAVTVIRRETFEYGFKAKRHLLIAHERGERYDGETNIEGLPKSTQREFNCKLSFVPAGLRFYGWQTPRVLTRVTYFYIDWQNPLFDPESVSPARRSLACSSSIKASGIQRSNSRPRSVIPIHQAANTRKP